MPADVQAPDLSLNVKYSREDKKNGEQKEESHLEIYKNVDTLKHIYTDPGCHEVRSFAQSSVSAVHRRRCVPVTILGVMYLLILAGIFMRHVLATLDNRNLLTERDQFNISLKQAQTKIINLTEERDELQNRYNILSKNYSQLEEEQRKPEAQPAVRSITGGGGGGGGGGLWRISHLSPL